MTPHATVVGGGISGLVSALRLSQAGYAVDLYEADDQLGGKLRTAPFEGDQIDLGADAFLVRSPEVTDLADELGIADQLIEPAVSRAFVVLDDELRPFPEGLVFGIPSDLKLLTQSGLISPAGVDRARQDLTEPFPRLDGDVAVGPLVRERLGDEITDRLVAPLLAGINAGDPDELSLRAGAAQIDAMARHGSLIRGAAVLRAGASSSSVFRSFRAGAGHLAEVLVAELSRRSVDLRLAARVTGLQPDGDRWTLESRHPSTGETRVASTDLVVLATPAPASAQLLRSIVPDLSEALGEVDYASVAVAVVVVARSAIGHPLDGSGFLVPDTGDRLLTACSFGTSKWPHWTATQPDHVVFRLSAGRFGDQRFQALDDHELIDSLIDELAPLIDLDSHLSTPKGVVQRWPIGLAQYRPGHLDRVDEWELQLADTAPTIALCGAYLRGVGIPACVASANRATHLLFERTASGHIEPHNPR